MTYFRVAQAAALLGVSDDTVRRNISLGRLPVRIDESKRRIIDGVTLAAFARDQLTAAPDPSDVTRSARNYRVDLVTDVQVGEVMAQVEMQGGPHLEAVDGLGLTPGVLAVAVIKSTDVDVQVPLTAARRPDDRDGAGAAE